MLGVICGMEAEAATLGARRGWLGERVVVAGADPDRAEAAARALIARGCRRLLSWGVCGGLVPRLVPGALVRPDAVIAATGERWPLDPLPCPGTQTPDGAAPDAEAAGDGLLLGLDRALLGAADKAAAAVRFGAISVDMETHRIARAAAAAGVPVTAVRTVADPSRRSLPDFVAGAVDAAGHPRLGPVLAGLARRPGTLPVLIRLGRDRAAALATLQRVAESGALDAWLDAPG